MQKSTAKPHSTAMSLKAAADFSTPEVKTLMLMPQHGMVGGIPFTQHGNSTFKANLDDISILNGIIAMVYR